MTLTLGRHVHAEASAKGYTAELERFGVQLVNDTCWCMLQEPVVPPGARTLITNSAKYAHYAPGLVGRHVRFAALADCVLTAATGKAPVVRQAAAPVQATPTPPAEEDDEEAGACLRIFALSASSSDSALALASSRSRHVR